MVRAMLATCLSLLLAASCVVATPLFSENFDTGCTQNNRNIPGFEIDVAVIADMRCDNSVSKSASFSAKVLPANGQVGTLAKTLLNVPIDGRTIKTSFWLRYGSTNNVYPNGLIGSWIRVIGANAPWVGSLPRTFTVTREAGVAPVNGWYKFSGEFVLTAPLNDPSATQMNIAVSFTFSRTIGESATPVWMDDALIDYAASAVIGDPQFVGLRGQSYQVHGIDGAVYNLVSSASTQVNSRFVFLDHGKCPMFDGAPARNCWAHPGSYLGEIGVQQIVDGVTHKLEIVAGASDAGFGVVKLDGKDMSIGDQFADTELFSVKYESSHSITVHTAEFSFTFENSDMFINQAVSSTKPMSQLTAHGMLGQTHKRAVYPNTLKYIAGEIDDYLIGENELFGQEFVYNMFHSSE